MSPRAAPWLTVAVIALALRPRAVLAHAGAPPAPHDLWRSWSPEPAVLAAIALAGFVYGHGVLALWERAGAGRGVRVWQAAAFAAGLLTLLIALVSPLDALGSALFSAHMVQHLLLMLVAAPLLVLGQPLVPALWALPFPWRRGLGGWWRRSGTARAGWRSLAHPVTAWALHAAVLWVWHAPRLYETTLTHAGTHALEHTLFLATALLFWWTIVHAGRRGRPGHGAGLLSVFAMAVQSGALGALITFSPRPWYPAYAPSTAAWGLSPLQDQQLAGLLMWVPAGAVYLIAAGLLFAAWLAAAEQHTRRYGRGRTSSIPRSSGAR